MPNLQPYLAYFSKWKLNSASCLDKKAEVIQASSFSLTVSGGHILRWPRDFCTPSVHIPVRSPPLCVNGISDVLVCYRIWQSAWDIISVIMLCDMVKVKR